MTDEEKAKQLYCKYRETDFAQESAAFNAAMDMAQWKDDKFYMILACIKYSLEKSPIDGVDEFINNIKKEWEK